MRQAPRKVCSRSLKGMLDAQSFGRGALGRKAAVPLGFVSVFALFAVFLGPKGIGKLSCMYPFRWVQPRFCRE